jgi:hypothetical protein
MSADAACDRDDRNELMQLVTALARRNAALWPCAGPKPEPKVYEVRPTHPRHRVIRCSAHTVSSARARGLLEAEKGCYRLSSAGRAWLRRKRCDMGSEDAFRAQHQERSIRALDPAVPAAGSVLINDAESPLAWLRRRKDARTGRPMLDAAQFAAGERLRADYWFAQLSPRITSNWSALMLPTSGGARSLQGPSAELRDDVIAARQRVTRALAAVGPELSGVLVDVCCHLQGLEAVEAAAGWPQRAGKLVLQLALTRLARHYGLIAEPGQATRERRVLHWGSADYRPILADPGEAD